MSDGPSCVSMNRESGLPAVMLAPAADVVVVQENREQPDVVFRRLGLLVFVGADLPDRTVRRRHRAAVQLDQLERLHGLRLAVLDDLEVALLQVGDGRAAPVRHDDIDANEVDAGPEQRRLRIRRLIGRRRCLIGVAAAGVAGCGGAGCPPPRPSWPRPWAPRRQQQRRAGGKERARPSGHAQV